MSIDRSTYAPRDKQALVLDRAYELVVSVPYRVSARWLFYRLLQEGFYTAKEDYKGRFLPAISRARHAFYKDWRPDTLADETREAIYRGHGHRTEKAWMLGQAERITCSLNKWHGQDNYVELWFEARAMVGQFEHYTTHTTLRPMGGQPSIPYKWDTAKFLEQAYEAYGKPLVVLYFGDLDRAGGVISDVIQADVATWCQYNFEFVRCGLTLDQATQYNVPENPEKPGEYQWEALSDDAAREIITTHVSKYVDADRFAEVEAREQDMTTWLRAQMVTLADTYGKEH